MTEKNYNPEQRTKKSIEKIKAKVETPNVAPLGVPQNTELGGKENNVDEKTAETEKPKKPIQKKPKVKKNYAVVDSKNVHVSTKYSISICKFIKNKKIEKAIADLEDVLAMKKAVPMKGEYAHRKNVGKTASGRGKYPQQATKHFLILLKSLQGNANYNEINEPVITEAVANIGERPYGRFGSVKRKRTHIRIVAKEKKMTNKNSKKKNKMEKKR